MTDPNYPEYKSVHQIVEETYFTSATGRAPSQTDLTLMANINAAVKQLGLIIEIDVPPGRNKSLAKTALEEVQMRAVRAIFSPVG